MKVSRRSFVGAAAATLLLPSWIFAPRRVRNIDLSLFCDEDYIRYSLSKPFFQEGLTYATDARICVRTTLIDVPPNDSEERRLPPAAGLQWEHDVRGWRSLADARVIGVPDDPNFSVACPTCYGKGRVGAQVAMCARCEAGSGSGDAWRCDCHNGYRGGSQCPECNGSQYVDYAIDAGEGCLIAPAYRAKLLTLGDVDYAPIVLAETKGKLYRGIVARFDGGEALLMGLNEV